MQTPRSLTQTVTVGARSAGAMHTSGIYTAYGHIVVANFQDWTCLLLLARSFPLANLEVLC